MIYRQVPAPSGPTTGRPRASRGDTSDPSPPGVLGAAQAAARRARTEVQVCEHQTVRMLGGLLNAAIAPTRMTATAATRANVDDRGGARVRPTDIEARHQYYRIE